MFLLQLSVSLVGGELAKLHVATLGMADWKLCPLSAHVDLISTALIHPDPSFIKGEENKNPIATHSADRVYGKYEGCGNGLNLLLQTQTHSPSAFLS